MPAYQSQMFQEFDHGSFTAHKFQFSIDQCEFVVIFNPVDISVGEYHEFRNDEVGFQIPDNCYDVKFDRKDNFDNGTYYKPPTKEQTSRCLTFGKRLSRALVHIISLHYSTYNAKAYFAVAESDKLKRFYDRILHEPFDNVLLSIDTDCGEGGMGYAFKTRCF